MGHRHVDLQVTNEESVLEEAIANLREAAQKIRATQNLMP